MGIITPAKSPLWPANLDRSHQPISEASLKAELEWAISDVGKLSQAEIHETVEGFHI